MCVCIYIYTYAAYIPAIRSAEDTEVEVVALFLLRVSVMLNDGKPFSYRLPNFEHLHENSYTLSIDTAPFTPYSTQTISINILTTLKNLNRKCVFGWRKKFLDEFYRQKIWGLDLLLFASHSSSNLLSYPADRRF